MTMTFGDVMRITQDIHEEFKSIFPQFAVSEGPAGTFNIQCRARTTDLTQSPDNPIYGIGRIVMERLAGGRQAWIRVYPEVEVQTDFEKNEKSIMNYVRFSFKDELGKWESVQNLSQSTPSQYAADFRATQPFDGVAGQ
jgi:hypothetical protein